MSLPRRLSALLFFVSLSLIWAPDDAGADERPILAVYDIQAKTRGFDPRVLDALTDFLAARMTSGGFQVVPREQIRIRLRDRKMESYKECYDQNCQIELGRELAAQKTLATQITRIGETCQLTAFLYDLKKATTDQAATSEVACQENALLEAVRSVAASLCKPLMEKVAAAKKPTDFDIYLDEVMREQSKKNRQERAWEVIQGIVTDPTTPHERKVEALKRFLAEFANNSPHASEAKEALAGLLPGFLTVITHPPGAQIRIDGELVANSPLTTEVATGLHEVTAKLSGFGDVSQSVEIRSDQNSDILLMLRTIVPSVPEVSEQPVAEDLHVEPDILAQRQHHMPYNIYGHVFFWTGLGLTAFGGVCAVLASEAADDYAAGHRSASQTSKTWAGLMYAGFGTGLALMATGLGVWLVPPELDEPDVFVGSIGIVPSIQGLGVSIGGSW